MTFQTPVILFNVPRSETTTWLKGEFQVRLETVRNIYGPGV